MSERTGNGSAEVKLQVWGHTAGTGEARARIGLSGPSACASIFFWSPLLYLVLSCLCCSQTKLSTSWFPSLISVTCFSLPALFFFLSHRSTSSHRLFLKGQWKILIKASLTSAVLPLLCGGVCTAMAKQPGWKFQMGSRIWDWTFLAFASATYGDSLSSFGFSYSLYFPDGAQLLNLNAKEFVVFAAELILQGAQTAFTYRIRVRSLSS